MPLSLDAYFVSNEMRGLIPLRRCIHNPQLSLTGKTYLQPRIIREYPTGGCGTFCMITSHIITPDPAPNPEKAFLGHPYQPSKLILRGYIA